MSATKQPEWKFVSNLGDRNPIEHGGLFVYVDTTGVYPPEMTKLASPNGSGNEEWWEYRAVLEPLTAETIRSEWFSDRLDEVAAYSGLNKEYLIAALTGEDLTPKAIAWDAIGGFHGFDNFDPIPHHYVGKEGRAKVEQRFWYEAGEDRPPAGTKYLNQTVFYDVEPFEPTGPYSYENYCNVYPTLANSVGITIIGFHHRHRCSFQAGIALGHLF